MKIWRCPTCSSAVRAPEHLQRLDIRRWCLKCSARSGKLVERTIPSKEAEAQRRAAARAVATAKRQERRAVADSAAKETRHTLAAALDRAYEDGAAWLRARAPKIVKLTSLRRAYAEHHPYGARWAPTITIRQGGILRARDALGAVVATRPKRYSASGHAWPTRHRLTMTTGASAADDLSTLIHELAHLAAPDREHHGPIFQVIQRDAVAELTGVEPVGWRREGDEGRIAVIQRWLDGQKGTSP
jgi:hypothetical protein